MASQQQSRIQSYLERNKIGPLFEVSSFIYKKKKKKTTPWIEELKTKYSLKLDRHVHAAS